MKSNKIAQIQLLAYLNVGDEQLKGKLSISDGFFIMPPTNEFYFYRNGTIDFKYDGKDYSFPIENLGGKYFIKGRKDGKEYESVSNMIVLNETLEKSELKVSSPKVKM